MPVPSNAYEDVPLRGFVLIDPETRQPYKAAVINQAVENGEINTSDLSKQSTQEAVLTEIQALRSESAQARPVTVENPEMPLPEGAATSAGQTQIVSKLNELYTLLGSQLSVVLENEGALDVAVASLPLPAGASTAQKQDTLLAAIQAGISVAVSNDINAAITSLPAVQLAANQSVSVGGTVNIGNFPATQPVSGSVNVGNFPATTRISGADTPLPVSANSPFPVTQSGSWNLAVSNFPESTQVSNFPSTQAVTQSGTWNFGAQDSSGARVNALTTEPATDARGLVTRNIPSGVQPVSGTVAATQSGAWSTAISNFPATQPVSGTVTANLGAPGTGATSLGKAEDAAHASGDTGIATWGVRNDGGTTALTSANGDYSPQAVDNAGSTWVRNRPAISSTVTSVATSTTSATLAAADANRLSVIIHNSGTADLLVKYGATASATSFTTRIVPAGTMGVDSATWAGVIDCVASTGTGTARVTVMS
jgi:hypothetical protein